MGARPGQAAFLISRSRAMQAQPSSPVRLFLGQPAHSPFRLSRLSASLAGVAPGLGLPETAHVYAAWCERALSPKEEARLCALLDAAPMASPPASA